MNRTRFQWSYDLKCCKDRKTSTLAFISISSLISVIPIFFYAGFFMYGRRREESEFITASGNLIIALLFHQITVFYIC